MIVALDATALILLLDREASGPIDRATGKRVSDAQDRIAYLAARVGKSKGGRIFVPTPAYAEAAVKIDPAAATQHLAIFDRLRGFRVADFNRLAALEFALMQQALLAELPRFQRRGETGSRAKAKFDQQIVAIAKVERAAFIVTDDDGLASYARRFGLKSLRVAELEVPPAEVQASLPLEPPVEPEPSDEF